MPDVSTPSGSGLLPRSGDIIGAGSAQLPSDGELPPLPPSLCIPSLQFLRAGSGNRSHEGTSAADEAGAHRDPAHAAKQHLLRRTNALAPCPLPGHRPTRCKPHAPYLATDPCAASSTAALRAAGRTAVSRPRSGRAGSTASSAPPGGPPPPHPLWMPAPAPSVASGGVRGGRRGR